METETAEQIRKRTRAMKNIDRAMAWFMAFVVGLLLLGLVLTS